MMLISLDNLCTSDCLFGSAQR